ncbi:PepSY domain-containing protein [Luteimonas sp. YGD11-2]|uniref:PepSY domain-containing protein n=1 Tax=Luteimonas sp. YGD11-2 TaxID=2508168 RepID=UPI0013E8FCBE|nr:PepSY domain-containing protein [Luteimonas sp. YGD11-2]
MKQRHVPHVRVALLALALSAAGTAVAQQTGNAGAMQADTSHHGAHQATMTEAQVRAALEGEGFRNVRDLEFEHGLWSADVDSADGNKIDVYLDPASGEVFPDNATARISENEVRARLTAGGYQHIDDVEFDDGIWKAEARNAQGQKLNLRIAPTDGRVLHERID